MTKRNGANNPWFAARVREAQDAGSRDPESAIRMLTALADQCRDAAVHGVSDWHEIQSLWLLGGELEAAGRFDAAAAAYARIVAVRRLAQREASEGLWSALAATAACAFRSGNRRAGKKLATEVLRDGAKHVAAADLRFLKSQLRKPEPRKTPRRPRRAR